MLYDALDMSVRILFLALIPLLSATTGAGVIIGILQTATSIQEPALGYSVRLVAFVASLYLVLPGIIEMLLELMTMGLQ
jgi:type III secretory pathway component EscS